MCFTLVLVSTISASIANNERSDEQPLLSQDRRFIESDCPYPGIQEINIYKNGDFKMTSYNLETKEKTLELSGKWELYENNLILNYNDSKIEYQMDSKIHDFLNEEFLLASLVPVKSNAQLPFTDCRYHDHRLIKSLIGIE